MNPLNALAGRTAVALAMLALASCAAVPIHDAQLEDARTYVYGVRSDPNVLAYAPVEINQAIVTLKRADDTAANGGSLTEIHDLAALARERATLAQQTAGVKAAEVAAQVERQRLEVAARARAADVAQRNAREAQRQADSSRQQAAVAQQQADAAQRNADSTQQQAAAVQQQGLATTEGLGMMRGQLQDLGPRMMDRGLVVTLTDIEFDQGGANLQPAGQDAVSRIAAYLSRQPALVISVEGFTDDAGNTYRNQKLSEQRALAVQSALTLQGIDPRRIIVHGYGPAYPIASNDTSMGRQMNSRVEIVVSDRGFVPPRA
jgi:outer membrane protein OmpA-like peptidoglycan-associated protein